MNKFLMLCFIAICLSCNNSNYIHKKDEVISTTEIDKPIQINNDTLDEKSVALDSVKKQILSLSNLKDTVTYNFSLEGDLSAEGNAGKAFYKNGKVNKIDVTFYRETGKSTYSYSFGNKVIAITQNIHDYDVPLSGNIVSTKKQNYKINYAGKLIKSDAEEVDLDTYFLLKKSIPFTLK